MSLPDAFREQAGHCARLGSAFMAQLLQVLAHEWHEDLPLAAKFAAWEGDIGPLGASLPLRLAGGLHALVLSGADAKLAAVYPPNAVTNADLWAQAARAMQDHAAFLDQWTDSAPQTNEVRRSAVLIAAGQELAAQFAMPMVLSELGASGGLNLMWDRYALVIGSGRYGPEAPALTLAPTWSGPVPPVAQVHVEARRGVDLNPLVAHNAEDALRLMAYLWADQPDRLERTRAAIAVQEAMVDRGDAIEWLERRLRPMPGRLHVIYHTIAWQYFPHDAQARGTALIEAAGARATADAPLAWLSMENDGAGDGAAVTLRIWPGDEMRVLGRADFHGRWIKWGDVPAP